MVNLFMIKFFRNFLLHNIWYDADYCMKTLLHLRMYDCTLAVVKVHSLYESLAKEIITMDSWDENDGKLSSYGILFIKI